MKVYTAHRVYGPEGFDIIGVFDTAEGAQKCCADDVYTDSVLGGRERGESHEVVEHELQIKCKVNYGL